MTADSVIRSASWQRHLAARTVAAQVHDAQDLALLLDMLGLSAAEGRTAPKEPVPQPPRRPVPRLEQQCATRLTNLLRARISG